MHCLDVYSKLFLLPRFQLQVDGKWDQEYGTSGGNEMKVELNDDEHITAIFGTYSPTALNQLTFFTDKLRELMLGSFKGMHEFSSYPKTLTHMFRGLCAFYGPGGIKGIRILWGSINSTCTE